MLGCGLRGYYLLFLFCRSRLGFFPLAWEEFLVVEALFLANFLCCVELSLELIELSDCANYIPGASALPEAMNHQRVIADCSKVLRKVIVLVKWTRMKLAGVKVQTRNMRPRIG